MYITNKIKKPITKGHARVPVVIQLDALECGAASLCMIMAYYDKWIPLEQVRSDCDVSRDGSKASNILKTARKYGLDATGYRFEPKELQSLGKFPCIIHWNFNHFVVLNGFSRTHAYINDPGKGTCVISMEEFDRCFTGICLIISPGANFEQSGKQKSIWSFAKKRLTGTAPAITFVILSSIITALLGLISPIFSRIFMDRLLTGKNPEWLHPFMIGLIIISLLSLIVSWINSIHTLKLNGKLAIVSDSTYLWHVLRLPMKFFSQRMSGDIAMRQSLNAGIANTLITTFTSLMLQTVMMFFYLIVVIRYSVLLTTIGLISVLVNIVISKIISTKQINFARAQMRDQGMTSSLVMSGIDMIETIKSTGAEKGFFQKWSGYQASLNNRSIRLNNFNRYINIIPSVVSTFTSTAILLVGVWLTMQGEFTIGMIMAFQGLLSNFTTPMASLISSAQTIQEMRTNMERIEDVMEFPTDVNYSDDLDDTTEYSKLSGNILMRNVTFGYSNLSEPLIKDFNLSLEQGKSVALVGGSGCGKSTLSKLISGLYKPWSGEILFDNKAISDIDHNIFTGSVAIVDQDIVLFEDTIKDNIKMWDHSIEDFEMILAAKDACLHDDIIDRNKGYNNKLLEGGKDLSGGQCQRMEIARVLAQDPTLIILDEATSALDAKTEFKVMEAIKNRGITCVIIAHRLSTIRDCDEILVLDKGVVIERGTHDELYALNGLYTTLVTNE